MIEKFGKQEPISQMEAKSGKFETEAIPKIEKLLNSKKFPSWELIADFLFPEILPEKRAAFKEKWRGEDLADLNMENPRLKEYSEDRQRLDNDLEKFIKPKSPRDILERAQDVFDKYLRKGAIAISVNELMTAHHQAYEVARLFLTKDIMKEAAQSCLDMLWRRIKEVDINNPRKMELMKEILGIKNWLRDVGINLSRSPEKSGKILSYFLVEGSLTEKDMLELFKNLVATREIKTKGDGKTKIKKIIVGRAAFRESTKEELLSLIGAGKKDEVIMATNFLEKMGILDLSQDADFFETITESKQ